MLDILLLGFDMLVKNLIYIHAIGDLSNYLETMYIYQH